MTPVALFQLTAQDRASALWPKLMALMEHQRDALRRRNDGALSELETATLRGQIRQLTILLDLDKETPRAFVPDPF